MSWIQHFLAYVIGGDGQSKVTPEQAVVVTIQQNKEEEEHMEAWQALATALQSGVEEFASREAYKKATGQECPAFDVTKDRKYFREVNAKPTGYYMGRPVVTYATCFGQECRRDTTGRYVLTAETMDLDFAKTVNIPETGDANLPGVGNRQTPLPLVLSANQAVMMKPGAIQVPMVRNLDVVDQAEEDGKGFLGSDRDLLVRIAAKVGA